MTEDNPKSHSTALALKLCRLLIFALIALLTAATIYVVALGGVASAGRGARIIETRILRGGPAAALALPNMEGAQTRSVIVKCTNENGKRNCQTTGVPPAKASAKLEDLGALPDPGAMLKQDTGKAGAKPTTPSATKTAEQHVIVQCREENGQRHCTTTNGNGSGDKIETDKRIIVRGLGADGAQLLLDDLHGGPIDVESLNLQGAAPSPWHNALNGVLACMSLVLLLIALFNLERLFAAVEGASLFSLAAVRRLQWIGAALLAGAVLPHFELPALIENAGTALSLGQKPWPATVLFSLEFNLMLLVAGLFLILMARVVEEGVWLHDEMRGTV